MLTISVIIPTYNSAKTIAQTIEAIQNQEYLSIKPEIIIVDDGSKDETLNIIRKFERIKIISQPNSGPATARNKGASIANGDILVFTDSDTVPHKDWLKHLTKPFENTAISAATGTYSIENSYSKLAELIQYEIENKHNKYGEFVAFGGTYNLALRKSLFLAIGGFNEKYRYASGEDVDICYKILNKGYKIKFVKEAVVGHFHPENLRNYLRNQFKHGFWRAKLYYDHPNKATGDDYTGLKEIIETLSAIFTILSPFVFVVQKLPFYKEKYLHKTNREIFKYLSSFPLLSLLFIEYSFVSKLYSNTNSNGKNLPSKLYASIVFVLRAIYRTLGFVKGLVFIGITNYKHLL